MITLAFDTALQACACAVTRDDAVLASRREPMARGHAERLAPMIVEVLAEAGIGFRDIGRIGVTTGPGTFTGVRVGLAMARGLSLQRAGARLPAVGVSTLEVLAAAAAAAADGARADAPIFAAIDARRGQIYAQAFAADGRSLAAAMAAAPADAAAALVDPRGVAPRLVGSGASLAAAALAAMGIEGGQVPGDDQPDPAVLARLAARAPAPTAPPQPIYLRAPDARPSARAGPAARS